MSESRTKQYSRLPLSNTGSSNSKYVIVVASLDVVIDPGDNTLIPFGTISSDEGIPFTVGLI